MTRSFSSLRQAGSRTNLGSRSTASRPDGSRRRTHTSMGLTSMPLFNKMLASPETECRLTSAAWTQVRDGLERATSVHLEVAWVDRRVRALAASDGRPVSANAYRSSGGAPGWHRNEHDALIEQLAGRRRWWLHPPTPGTEPPRPDRWRTLGPGDRLELPAGWWRLAYTLSATATHLTYTFHR